MNDETYTGFSFKKAFGRVLEIAGEVLGRTVVEELSEIPGVEEILKEESVKAGKNVLWSIFPFIALGAVVLIVLVRKS